MPVRYECYICGKIFAYTRLIKKVKNKTGNWIRLEVSCKQRKYSTLGCCGDDYICGDCIRLSLIEEDFE